MQKIMIVEDDSAIREELAVILENHGYDTFSVTDFTDITALAKKQQPDLILLDIGLPEQDGFTLCTSKKLSARPLYSSPAAIQVWTKCGR